jgi:hypothetical protein
MKNRKKRIYPVFVNYDTCYSIYFSQENSFQSYYSTYPEIYLSYSYRYIYNICIQNVLIIEKDLKCI